MIAAAGVAPADRGAAVADEVSVSLEAVAGLANQTAASVQTITVATQQRQTGTDLLDVTHTAAELGQAAGRSSERLATLSEQPRSTVARFQSEQTR